MANVQPNQFALKVEDDVMNYQIFSARIKAYSTYQDSLPADHRRGWKRFSHVLAMFLALAAIPVASPAQRPRLRLEARERISELERLREQRGVNDPAFQKKLERVQREFGVGSRLLRPQRPHSAVRFSPRPEHWLGHTSVDKEFRTNIREAQSRLSEQGYLGPKDVDGKIGPRTRQGVSKFQTEHGLQVTGKFDSATEDALGLKSLRGLDYHGGFAIFDDDSTHLRKSTAADEVAQELPATLVLESLKSNLSAQYRLIDASGNVLFWGDDQDELAKKLNESLSNDARQSLYVEMRGFSEDKAEALASSFRIQQHLIDRGVSIGVLPHIDENLAVHQNLFTPGIMLERVEVPVESINSGQDAGQFQQMLPFRRRVGQGVKQFTLRIVCAARVFILEFHEILKNLLPAGKFDNGQSLSQLVDRARRDLMKRHKGLTNQQFKIEVIDQFGSIRMSELYRRALFAWS